MLAQVPEDQVEVISLFEENKNEKPFNQAKKSEDLNNIFFLTFLYVILGIPIGLAFSIPLILSTRKVSYSEQGTYSFAIWPFSLKLLWAPLIDAFFVRKIGRRKTWVVSCQFISGLVMIILASRVNKLIDENIEHKKKEIFLLALFFGLIVFLSATQDVALDAWSLDLLMEKNAPLQALCNSIGFGIGQFVGNAGFLIFESVEFSNKYIRPFLNLVPQEHGIVTLEKFFYIFGSISIFTSIMVLLFKNEYNLKKLKIESERLIIERHEMDSKNRSIWQTYIIIWKILCIKPIRILVILMATFRFSFWTESVIRLKLVENGFTREKLSLMGIVLSPILTLIPIVLSKFLKGPKPLKYFNIFIGLKIIIMVIFCIFLKNLSIFRDKEGNYSIQFYFFLFLLSLIKDCFGFGACVTLGGFNARITDRLIGGTYMTFLAFWPSLGSILSKTSSLFAINLLTFKKCDIIQSNSTNLIINYNSTKVMDVGDVKCELLFDPFYPLTGVLLIYGIIWVLISRKYFKRLQSLTKEDWQVNLEK